MLETQIPLLLAVLVLLGTMWRVERTSRLERRTHAQQARFEKEFQILADIWNAVVRFESCALALRPSMEVRKGGESDSCRTGRKLEEYMKAREHMLSTFRACKPFYPPEIFNALSPLIREADSEQWDYLSWGESCIARDDPEAAIEEKEERRQLIADLVDDLCESIRARAAR